MVEAGVVNETWVNPTDVVSGRGHVVSECLLILCKNKSVNARIKVVV
jgi:hypothetical protein